MKKMITTLFFLVFLGSCSGNLTNDSDVVKDITQKEKEIEKVIFEELSKEEIVNLSQEQINLLTEEEKEIRNKYIEFIETEKLIEDIKTNWHYTESENRMNNTKMYLAQKFATNSVDFQFPYNGGTNFIINIRNMNNKNDVYFAITKGQFLGTYRAKYVKIKFDDNEAFNVTYSESNDGSSNIIFLDSVDKIINGIKGAKTMLIEAEYYKEGKKIAEFDVEGLEWEH